MVTLQINGAERRMDVSPDMPLLWVLREVLGLMDATFDCEAAQCGACAVYLNGAAIYSCQLPVGVVENRSIVTFEAADHALAGARATSGRHVQ